MGLVCTRNTAARLTEPLTFSKPNAVLMRDPASSGRSQQTCAPQGQGDPKLRQYVCWTGTWCPQTTRGSGGEQTRHRNPLPAPRQCTVKPLVLTGRLYLLANTVSAKWQGLLRPDGTEPADSGREASGNPRSAWDSLPSRPRVRHGGPRAQPHHPASGTPESSERVLRGAAALHQETGFGLLSLLLQLRGAVLGVTSSWRCCACVTPLSPALTLSIRRASASGGRLGAARPRLSGRPPAPRAVRAPGSAWRRLHTPRPRRSGLGPRCLRQRSV